MGLRPAPHKYAATPWQVAYQGTGDTSDGFVESPYFMANFDDDTLWQVAGLSGGNSLERLILTEGVYLELLPLFSTDAATAMAQLWGFELTELARHATYQVDGEDPEPRIINKKSSNSSDGLVLGECYNIARDDPGSPRSVAFVAKDEVWTIKPSLALGENIVRDQNGETFAVGAKHTFSTAGFRAFFLNVPVLSAGTLVVAARFLVPAEAV